MRIVNIVTQMEGGGTQASAMRMAAEMRKRGHVVETWFLYLKRPTYVGQEGVRVLLNHRPRGKAGYIRVLIALIRALRAFKPDVVISFARYANVLGQIGAFIAGVPVRVASQRNSAGVQPRLARCLDWMIGSTGVYSANIAVSHSVYDSFEGYPASYVKRLRVIQNGLVFNESLLEPAQAREKFRLPQQVPLVVNTGRLAQQKNHEILLRALPSLPEVHLAIAGDGELRDSLSRKALDLAVADRVHFLGELLPRDIPDFLKAGDLFALPSLVEGFSNALLEAMHGGLPIVASAIPAVSEAVGSGSETAGILVPPGDERAWVQALRRVLEDSDLRTRLSSQARQRARQFEMQTMVDRYEQCLRDASASPGVPSKRLS